MPRIVIVGSSGHAKVVIGCVESRGEHKIVGLLDRFRAAGELTLGHPVLGSEADLPRLVSELAIEGAIIAIGDNFVRAKVATQVAQLCPGLPFVAAVHLAAVVASDVCIGAGTVVMAGAVINASCTIGRHCVVNTHASLDHDSMMAEFASLAPGVTTGGRCSIGSGSAICIAATLKHGVSIGDHSLIGAGATVLSDIPDRSIAYGTPARVVRLREPGEKYL